MWRRELDKLQLSLEMQASDWMVIARNSASGNGEDKLRVRRASDGGGKEAEEETREGRGEEGRLP